MLKFTCISIIFIVCLIHNIHGQLIIKPSESIISRDQFKPFIALCNGQGTTRAVNWESPLQIIIEENNNARVTVERRSSGLRLRIRNLTRNDQGIWKCLGSDQNGNLLSNNLQINVKIPITFIGESIQYAELNSSVLIKCQILSNPSAEISWFKGENKINLIASNYEQTNDGLKINRVSSSDNDIFWCQGDVMETGESKDYPIQVILAQSITSPKITCSSPCAVEKRTATLICEANGIPTATFLWFLGQNVGIIESGISKYVIRGNRLIINYVDQTDNGRYSCHVFNDYDRNGQRVEYILNVIIPPQLSLIPQIEIKIDENSLPQHPVFACHIERGSPESLSLEWLYANKTRVQAIDGISIDDSQLKTNRFTELRFDPVRREHHGNYTCLAKNLAEATSTVAHLIVDYKPVFIGPNISYVFSVANYHVMMTCQFDSYPPPIIHWLKGHMILEDDDLQVINILTKHISSTLYETQLTYNPLEEDFGLNFECRAVNPRIEKHSITLRLAEPPKQARLLEVKPDLSSIELKLQLPSESGGLPLLRYIVLYEQIGVSNSIKNLTFPVVSNESQSVRIESLQASTVYRIQFTIESQAGQSAFSLPIQTTTLAGKVPQFNLISTENTCSNNTSCLIKWIILSNGGSPILRAEISYGKIGKHGKVDNWHNPINIEPLMTEYELKGLKPKTNYSISLRLFNTDGVGEQKIRKMTGENPSSKIRPDTPKIWVIIIVIAAVIVGFIIIFVLIILYRILSNPKKRQKPDTLLPNPPE